MANSLIDFGIVQPEASGSFLRGFQGAQALAQQQAAQQQQNQLAALQLRAAQRGEEEALAEREAYKGASTLGDVQQRLMQAGLGKQSIALQKQIQDQRAAQIQQAKAAHDFVQSQLSGVIANPTRQAAEAAISRAESLGADVSQERERLKNTPDSDIAKWAFIESGNASKALEQSIIQLPGGGTAVEPKYAIPGAQARTDLKYVPGTPAEVNTMPYVPGTPAERMPLGVSGQTPPTRSSGVNALALPAPGIGAMAQGAIPTQTGGRYFPPAMTPQQQAAEARAQRQLQLQEQAANPEFQQQMAAAKQAGALAAKSSVEAQKTLPGAISKAEESLRLIDELVGKPGGKPHPGFETAVGMGLPLRFIPGTNAADFQARFDQVKGASFLAAFESLKGGGSITEKEGQKATSAINRMSLAQSEKEFITAARDLQNILQSGIKDAKRRLQNAAPSASAPSPASPAAGGAKFLGFE